MSDVLNIGEISFYWRTIDPEHPLPNIVPDFLPFSFTFDRSLQLIRQLTNPDILAHLRKIYTADFNVGYLQEGHDLAEGYGLDYLRFIEERIAAMPAKPQTLFEIGCGACYLMKALRGKGCSVEGLDPSPVSARRAAEYGMKVSVGFFPETGPSVPVDAIYHSDVLEHVEDPAGFLRNHKKHLKKGGAIFVSVPDCSLAIEAGDLSMIIHQHINFFDDASLKSTLEAAGFESIRIEKSRFGGSLYAFATAAGESVKPRPGLDGEKFLRFSGRTQQNIERFTRFVSRVRSDSKRTLGIYVPLRGIPYLSVAGVRDGFRFFDDDRGFYRKRFDGFPVSVENFQDMLTRPPTDMAVMSWSFGDKIKEKILLADNRIATHTLRELLE